MTQFQNILTISPLDIAGKISNAQDELVTLYFKKATSQIVESHRIYYTKCQLAQIRTFSTLFIQNIPKIIFNK